MYWGSWDGYGGGGGAGIGYGGAARPRARERARLGAGFLTVSMREVGGRPRPRLERERFWPTSSVVGLIYLLSSRI